MKRLLLFAALMAPLACAHNAGYAVLGDDPTSAWTTVLSSIGFQPAAPGSAGLLVIKKGFDCASACPSRDAVNAGLVLILEGASPLATSFGFTPTAQTVPVRRELDARATDRLLIWQLVPEVIPMFHMPSGAKVFSADKWSGAPLLAGIKIGSGAVLWSATAPGPQTYDRYPYLFQAMLDLGVQLPFQSRRLSAFLDYAYRANVDPDYFATKWRAAGLRAVHLSAWDFWEPNPVTDAWLANLVDACHRHGVLVYMWLELPHVSPAFWDAHPEWREKTALLQDATVFWRKLMNLRDPNCVNAIADGLNNLLSRADWDGVNLSELYFESLKGVDDLSQFTPMNDIVRAGFKAQHGFDPADLFNLQSPLYFTGNASGLQVFLDYRADLEFQLQSDWIARIDALRQSHPALDIVLTTVDDRYDPNTRNLIGADSARLLPLLDQYDFTFTIEDPGQLWTLGPQRYPELAALYAPLTRHADHLAVDINFVARPYIGYPSKQQTGLELAQLLNLASGAFHNVMFYSESSVFREDYPLLAAASARVSAYQRDAAGAIHIDSPYGIGLPWSGPALVDGQPWPVKDAATLWIPPGPHIIALGDTDPAMLLLDLNADLASAQTSADALAFTYSSSSRAIASVSRKPKTIEIDGSSSDASPLQTSGAWTLSLPRGAHTVTVH